MSGNGERKNIEKVDYIKNGKIIKCARCGSINLWISVYQDVAVCGEDNCDFLTILNDELNQIRIKHWKLFDFEDDNDEITVVE